MGLALADINRAAHFLIAANGGRFSEVVDGREVVTLSESATIEALTFYQELWEQGAVGPTPDSNVAMVIAPAHFLERYSDWPDDLGVVSLPRGPQSERYVVPSYALWQGVIPITVEEPRAVIELVSALWQTKAPYIEDIESWSASYWESHSLVVTERQTLTNWQWLVERAELIPNWGLFRALQWGGWNAAMSRILNEGANPVTVMAELTPQVQAELDMILNQ